MTFLRKSSLPFRGGAGGGGCRASAAFADRPHPNPSPEGEGLVALSAIFASLLLIFATPAAAQDAMPPAPYANRQLSDPAQEEKAQALMETLRCLKCQSQSIADSDAPMAGDMRSQVRQRIAAGEEPEAIRAWLVARYGDYVSYAPRVTALTWPLFAAPLAVLALAALLLRRRFGRRG